jgi:hypothetical protein
MPTITLPTQSHQISLDEAIEMTTRYRNNIATIINSDYADVDILPFSETFNKSAFSTFMSNEDCLGLRIYYGMDEDLKVHSIIVGVTDGNEDMLPGSSLTSQENILIEDAQRCPPACPPSSVLNEDPQ